MSGIFGGSLYNVKTMYLKLQNTRYYNKAKIALISSCSGYKTSYYKPGGLASYWLYTSNTIQEINSTFNKVITTKSYIFCRFPVF